MSGAREEKVGWEGEREEYERRNRIKCTSPWLVFCPIQVCPSVRHIPLVQLLLQAPREKKRERREKREEEKNKREISEGKRKRREKNQQVQYSTVQYGTVRVNQMI